MATALASKNALADRLRWLIDRSGLRQADVARLLGENPQWLSARVLGKHELTGPDIVRLAAALGVSPCAFFEEVQPPPQRVELAPESIERIAVDLAHTVAAATADAVVRALRERPPGEEMGRPLPPHGQERVREIARWKTAELVRRWEKLPEEEQEYIWELIEERRGLREAQERAAEPE